MADHYRVGQVFLVGDAAHIHPPPARRVLQRRHQTPLRCCVPYGGR
ncbi:FAD-dependent monooxygenase [Pseudomonas sp. ArH3a]|nr:FAD-dependent monooxygenase [Pseudomonas sp. ArH3a]